MFKDSFALISCMGAVVMIILFVTCFVRVVRGKKPFPWID